MSADSTLHRSFGEIPAPTEDKSMSVAEETPADDPIYPFTANSVIPDGGEQGDLPDASPTPSQLYQSDDPTPKLVDVPADRTWIDNIPCCTISTWRRWCVLVPVALAARLSRGSRLTVWLSFAVIIAIPVAVVAIILVAVNENDVALTSTLILLLIALILTTMLVSRTRRSNIGGAPDDSTFKADFSNAANKYGQMLRMAFPRELRDALKKLEEGTPDSPLLIVRGIYPSFLLRFGPAGSQNRPRWYIRTGLYDLISAALISSAGAVLRRKHAGDHDEVFQDFCTDPSTDKCVLSPRDDLRLWYRQVTPEFSPAKHDEHASARIVVMACVENAIRDPIYVLRVSDVIARLGESTFAYLKARPYNVIDGWRHPVEVEHENTAALVGGDWNDKRTLWMSYDPNRIIVTRDPVAYRDRLFLRSLITAIDKAAGCEAQVQLAPGDALVLDNYRALSKRKERGNRWTPTFGRKPVRWLRLFYGFPPRAQHTKDSSVWRMARYEHVLTFTPEDILDGGANADTSAECTAALSAALDTVAPSRSSVNGEEKDSTTRSPAA